MADWVPCCKDLEEKPEFGEMLLLTGLGPVELHYCLLNFWAWADGQSIDGDFPGSTPRGLYLACPQRVRVIADKCHAIGGQMSAPKRPMSERLAEQCPPLLVAMHEVGWLSIREDGVSVPNFDYWMGQSAKKRMCEARRKRNQRNKPPENGGASADKCHAIGGQKSAESVTTRQDNTVFKPPQAPPGGGRANSAAKNEPDFAADSAGTDLGEFYAGDTLEQIRGERRTMGDHLHLEPLVKQIARHYRSAVPRAPAARQVPDNHAILQLLLDGESPDKLKGAADRYGRDLRDGASAQSVRVFYGPSGSYSHYAERHGENSAPRGDGFVPPAERLSEPLSVIEARRKAGKTGGTNGLPG